MRGFRLVGVVLMIALIRQGRVDGLSTPAGGSNAGQAQATAGMTPEEVSRRDHQRLMDLLGIKELRAGEESDANYDEAKANIYGKLPDPLIEKSGKRVTTAMEWWSVRRPEIVAAFDREVLGYTPDHLPKVTWEIVSSKAETEGGIDVSTKQLAGHVDNSRYPSIAVTIQATLTTPVHAKGPVPVMIEIAFGPDFMNAVRNSIPEMFPGGPGNVGEPWQVQVLKKGWGYAILSPTSFQADSGSGLTSGIIGLMKRGQPRGVNDWGCLKAWAWGASRLLDYLETDKTVDAKQVGLEGHSRFGKTALVAMAYDSRFAIVYGSSSGEGGAKLYRHSYGEPLSHLMNAQLYQWMSPQMLKYAGPLTPADLPVDNHELIALCAPRPVFVGAGLSAKYVNGGPRTDGWADAMGMFLAEVAAGPVYKLLGKEDLGTSELPQMGTALIDGDLGFRQHQFGHTPAPNWPAFLEFAGRYFHSPGESR